MARNFKGIGIDWYARSERVLSIERRGDFPGSPVVKNLPSTAEGCMLDPWLGS